MDVLLKWNTRVAMFQWAVGFAVYFAAINTWYESRQALFVTLALTGFVTAVFFAVVEFVATEEEGATIFDVGLSGATAVFALAFASAIYESGSGYNPLMVVMTITCVAVAVFLVVSAARVSATNAERISYQNSPSFYPSWLYIVAALPYGVGAVIGRIARQHFLTHRPKGA